MAQQPHQQQGQRVQAQQSQDILSILAALGRGNFLVEASRKCGELAQAVIEVKAKGKLVITLDLEPGGFGKDGRVNQIDIRPDVKITKPEFAQGKSIFFVTPDSKLTREDPDQAELDFPEGNQ